MPDKKINQFATPTDGYVENGNTLWAVGDPGSGKMYKATGSQAKKAFATFKLKYVATGSEGTTLSISAIAGKEILWIAREGMIMYEVPSSPDSAEFIWDDTNITLGLAVTGAGERFLILYKSK